MTTTLLRVGLTLVASVTLACGGQSPPPAQTPPSTTPVLASGAMPVAAPAPVDDDPQVVLRTVDGHYVTADKLPMHTDATKIGPWERFMAGLDPAILRDVALRLLDNVVPRGGATDPIAGARLEAAEKVDPKLK